MSLMSKTRVESHTQKRSDERGALMLEAIALLGLMTLMSPMLVKQTSEKTQEVEEVTVAGQMKMLRDAAMSYIDANLGSLGDTSASGAFGGGYTGANGEKQSLVLDNRELAKFLPPGFCLEENGTCVFQNRLADNYRAAIVRQHSCDTRDAAGQRTDECKPFDYTVLVVSGPRSDNGTANEITDRRAMRIAAMIGADGGFIPSANMAAVTGDASKISVLGAQGIWEIPDVTDFFAANSSWRPGRGQVAVTTVYKGNSNLGEFLYRKPTSVEGGNAMFTDLDMAGKVGMPNDEDGTVTDGENGRGDPHDIKGVKGIFMASDGGLYVKALPRNTTLPGTAEFGGGLPLAQFTRTSMMTGGYEKDADNNERDHRIIHNLDTSTGLDAPGGTKIRHVDYNNVTNPTSPIGMLGGPHTVKGRATLDVFAPKVPNNPNTSSTNVGMSFNSQYDYDDAVYTAKSRMAIMSAGYRSVRSDREMMDTSPSSSVPQLPYIELESDIQDYTWDREFNVSLNLNPTSKGVSYSTLSDTGSIGSDSISDATEYMPSFNLSTYKRDEFAGFTYKGGLFARPYSTYVDELIDVPYSVNMAAAGNGREEPSLLLTRERNNQGSTRMTQLNMGSGAGNFDTVSLTSRLARRNNSGFYKEERAFVTLDEMPAQKVDGDGDRLKTSWQVTRPVRYRIGAEYFTPNVWNDSRDQLFFSGLEGVNTKETFFAQQARQDITTGGRLGAGEILKEHAADVTRMNLYKDIKDYLNWGGDRIQGGQTHIQFSGVEYKKYDRDFKSLISNNSATFDGAASTASLVARYFGVLTDTKAFITTMTGPFTTFGEEVVDYERYMSSNGYYDVHKKTEPAAADIARMEQGLQGYVVPGHYGYGNTQARIAMRTKDFYRDEGAARKKYVGTSLNMEPIAYAANSMLAPSVRLSAEEGDFNDSYLQSSANLKMYAYDSNPKASLFTKRLWNYGAKKYVSGNSAGGSGVEQTYRRKASGGLETEIASYNETAFENLYSKGTASGVANLFYTDTHYTAENNAEVRTRLSAFYEDNQDDETYFTDSSRAKYYDEEGRLIPLSARNSYYPTSINDMRDMAFATGEAQLDLTNLLNVAALGASGGYSSSPTVYASYQNPMSSYSPSAVLSAVSSDTSGVQTLAVDRSGNPFTNFTKASELKLRTYSLARGGERGMYRSDYSLSYIPSANLSAVAVMEQEDAYGKAMKQGSSLTMNAFDDNDADSILPQLRSSLITERVTHEQFRGFRNVDDWQKGKRTTSDFYSTDSEHLVERGGLDIKIGDTTRTRKGNATGAYTGAFDQYRKADVRLTSEAVSTARSYIARDLLRMTNIEDGAADGSESELELSSHVRFNNERNYGGVLGMSIKETSAQAGLTVGNQAPNLAMSQGSSTIFGFMTKTGPLGSQVSPNDLYGPVAPNANLNFYYPWTNTGSANSSGLHSPDVHAAINVSMPNASGSTRNEFLIVAPHNRISGGVQVTTAFRDTPIAEVSALHLSLNNRTTLQNPNAVFGRLVLTRTQLTDHSDVDELPRNIRPGAAIDLDTRYWTIRDGYIEIESDVYNYLGAYAADKHSRVYMFTSNGSLATTDGEENYWGTARDLLMSINSAGEYNYSTGRMDHDAGGNPNQKFYATGTMFKYRSVPGKDDGYFNVYNKFRLDPAYVSVMNDIKLTSRGGANLSDILPNYVLKSIYTLTNQYAKGPWPCQTNNDSLILKEPKKWNNKYDFSNSNPGNCSFVVPRGRLAKLPARKYTAGSSEQWYQTGYLSQDQYYDQNFETDCSLMNRFGYQNYCTMWVKNFGGTNPRSMFVSYASDKYYHCAGGESSGCLTHPFMGLVPAPGFKMSLNVYAPSQRTVTVDDRDAGLCPAGYLPVMTVAPTAFDVGKVIFIDAGSNVDAHTMPQSWQYTGGDIYVVNDLSKLPIVEEDDEITNVHFFTNPEYPKAGHSLQDVFQISRRFQNFGHQDYRTEVPFIYQPATRIAVAAKPLCATTPKNCLSQDFTDQLKNNGSSTADCGGSRRTLCGWAVAMGTVTPNKVKTSSNSPDYFWNMGGIFSGSMQALVHTYCYFNPKNFKFPNVRYDTEKGQLRPLDNQSLIMKNYDLN